ncbi:DUF58 domain-containing protein [Paenibacillus sedimenti]|uniref:DUF58 domain-containing protein n=1 Tax=Paenibacillus sedimenti TaxID=2770274 RepID=A0A926QLU0_9BACL|nr:DUF58 domain-containing protein [Paenibacillus sedimenti]MBD0383188.1 DUF58 domain-containing protein [Paenibacillus sedimenti]
MGISWVLLIAAVLVFAQHRFYTRRGFARLRIERAFNKSRCHVGDEVVMVETIANHKLAPIPWLRLESTLHAGLYFAKQANLEVSSGAISQNHRSLFSLMPYTKIVRRHQIHCTKRGWYKLETVAVSIGDLIGIQAAGMTQRLNLELLVYPQLERWEDIPLPSSRWQGDITVKRWIMQDPFVSSGVREYRYGDTMNSIHWKATARSQRLQVYNREFTADPRLLLVVNTQITESMWDAVTDPELVERGLSYAATLADHAVSQGIPVGFGYNGSVQDEPGVPVFIAPEGGLPHLDAMFETMAKLTVSCCRTCQDFLDDWIIHDGMAMDILLLTSFVSASMEMSIRQLEAMGHSVFIVPLQISLVDHIEQEVETSDAAI